MPVRIETKEIPAKTIETTIISVYGPDYARVHLHRTIYMLGVIASLLGGTLLLIPAIIENPAFYVNTTLGIFALLGCSTTIVGLSSFFIHMHEKILRKLLLKNGWDGKSIYRVELEYQTFLHD